jgi:RNA polymerase sigma factor (sigma-70 family)
MTRIGQTDFDRLVEAHRQAVRAYCTRRLPADAVDDAVAEVFSLAWRKRSTMPTGAGVQPWLYAVAHHVVAHEWRRAGRQTRLATKAGSLATNHVESVAEHAEVEEERQLALEAAARLSKDDREILRLTLWEELAPSDAAIVLGISSHAAKQRASRARRRLALEFNRLNRTPRLTTLDAGDVPR